MKVVEVTCKGKDGKELWWTKTFITKRPFSVNKVLYKPMRGCLALGHVELTYDRDGNPRHYIMGELDTYAEPKAVLRKLVKAFKDNLTMVYRTRHGYHFYTDIWFDGQTQYITVMRALARDGILDQGYFRLVEHRFLNKYPYLAILRLAGKHGEKDFREVYTAPCMPTDWHMEIMMIRREWHEIIEYIHLTKAIKCRHMMTIPWDKPLILGKKKHELWHGYMTTRVRVIRERETQHVTEIAGYKLIWTPDIVGSDCIYEYKSTNNPVTLALGLVQLLCYLSLWLKEKGERMHGCLMYNEPTRPQYMYVDPDEYTLEYVADWLENHVKHTFRGSPVPEACKICLYRLRCPWAYQYNFDLYPDIAEKIYNQSMLTRWL